MDNEQERPKHERHPLGEEPFRAIHFKALPPWHPSREKIKLREVPAFLRHVYGLTISIKQVYMWAKYGLPCGENGTQIYLEAKKFGGKSKLWYVAKADLMAFLEAGSGR